ncbi:MAG TPA: glycine zipper 2TM domain-containing protein [Burkholderiales bacterium]
MHIARTHPLAVGAALSVILCSLVAAAALTGLIPSAVSQKSDSLPAQATSAPCVNCGTVVAVREVQVTASPSGVGAVAGGLTGAVVGSQFGRGDSRTALTILGAAGGAVAGNSIEKNMHKSTAWRITVRMDDDSHRTVSQPEQPAFVVGDRVRIFEGRALALAGDARR